MTLGSNIPKEMLPKIISSFPAGIIISDVSGKIIFWNDKAREMLPSKKLDATKEEWVEVYGVYHYETGLTYKTEELPLARALSGEHVCHEKLLVKSEAIPQGNYLRVSAYPLYDDDGRMVLGIALMEDVSAEHNRLKRLYDKIEEVMILLKSHIHSS